MKIIKIREKDNDASKIILELDDETRFTITDCGDMIEINKFNFDSCSMSIKPNSGNQVYIK